MPRGGPDASCLDRLLETDRQEYLDRDDVDPGVKRSVVRGARAAPASGSAITRSSPTSPSTRSPRCPIRASSNSARGTAACRPSCWRCTPPRTSRSPTSNRTRWRRSRRGRSAPTSAPPSALVDATEIDAADGSFDLAVFALSFHHLPPAQAVRVIAEGTRVADKLLIIDLPRPPAPLHLRQVGDHAAVRAVRPVRPRRRHQFAAQLQPVGVAHPRGAWPTRPSRSNFAAVLSVRRWQWPRVDRLGAVGDEVTADRVQPRAPAAVPAEGPAQPGRVRDDARPVELRVRTPADRHGDRVQPRRRRLPARDDQPRGARRDRRSGVPDRIGRLQHRIQRAAASARR